MAVGDLEESGQQGLRDIPFPDPENGKRKEMIPSPIWIYRIPHVDNLAALTFFNLCGVS